MKEQRKIDLIQAEEKKQDQTIWVGEEDRIVSFHPVDTYEPKSFDSREFFFGYLHTLQTRGFRFQ